MKTTDLSTRQRLVDTLDKTGDQIVLLALTALTGLALAAILATTTATTGILEPLAGPALTLALALAAAAGPLLLLALALEAAALFLEPRHREPAAPAADDEEELASWDFPARTAA